MLSQRGKSTIKLQEGAATVCTASFQCVELTQPGDTAIITSTGGKVTIVKANNVAWSFASNCGGTPGLCSTSQYADATPPAVIPSVADDPTGMLCGR